MCIDVAHFDLGPADVAVDLAERLLVIRPRLSPEDKTHAARRALTSAGVPQPRRDLAAVRCLCGGDLDVVAIHAHEREHCA